MGSIKKLTSSSGQFHSRAICLWAPRLLASAVGLILLLSGLLKTIDMSLFIRQFRDYEIISNNVLLILSAWGVIMVEFILGTALIVSYRPKWTIPLTGFLLWIFLGATAWAWITGVTEDCGCFGNLVHRTPGEALIEDFVLMVALIPAWIAQRHIEKSKNNLKLWAIIAACVAGLILPEVFYSPISRIKSYLDESNHIQQRSLEIQDIGQTDLNHGSHLLVLISTDCQHCQESVVEFNMWAEKNDFPHPIAIAPNYEEEIETFINKFRAQFPVLQITEDQFWDLLEGGETPRIFLLRDGMIIKIWDGKVPDIEEIREVMGK